ncbi:hypothetical protein BGZ93_001307 [Podila epicladia]|nr:hypothetical protein BGZ93_001307 [Podila epicladia]
MPSTYMRFAHELPVALASKTLRPVRVPNGALSEALETNSILATLNLQDNSIGDNGALALSDTLKNNSTLTTLYWQNSPIGHEGGHALTEAVKSNPTLTAKFWWRYRSFRDASDSQLWSGLNWMRLDATRRDWARLDSTGLDWTRLDSTGQTGLDWTDWT